MARVKRGVTSHRKHKKILKLTRGYVGSRGKLIKQAKESLLHAGQYAFAGRKQRRRDLRSLWIIRLNAALKTEGISYSKFISALKNSNVLLNRKVLSELVSKEPESFKQIVKDVTSKA